MNALKLHFDESVFSEDYREKNMEFLSNLDSVFRADREIYLVERSKSLDVSDLLLLRRDSSRILFDSMPVFLIGEALGRDFPVFTKKIKENYNLKVINNKRYMFLHAAHDTNMFLKDPENELYKDASDDEKALLEFLLTENTALVLPVNSEERPGSSEMVWYDKRKQCFIHEGEDGEISPLFPDAFMGYIHVYTTLKSGGEAVSMASVREDSMEDSYEDQYEK